MKTIAKIDGQSLVDFINHDLLLNRLIENPVTLETNLITSGIIDSLSLIQLVTHLEKQFGIEIDDRDVNPDNFQSILTIINYLNSRLD